MDDFDDDPLDLLEDDDDGVIEVILMEEEEEKPIQERVGCAVLLFGIGSSIGAGWWLVNSYLA